jgi:hypothetical protein
MVTSKKRLVRFGALGLFAYDSVVRSWMLDWGASAEEGKKHLPGDDVIEDVMTHHTRAITIKAPPDAIWPWLVQIGDRRAGFYSYDWVERYLFPGTVHRIEGRRSATSIHPELQRLRVGDRINTGSIGSFAIGNPVTVLEEKRALVIGSWAFVLQPMGATGTRLLVRERDVGWLRVAAPKGSGVLRAIGALVDYVLGEPLHFAMTRKMMLGLKERAERSAGGCAPTEPAGFSLQGPSALTDRPNSVDDHRGVTGF